MSDLQPCYKKELCKWIGGRRDFTLLYKATRDRCSAETFHQQCNNKGPTVTVLYNTDGYVFGGYTSQSWSADADLECPYSHPQVVRGNEICDESKDLHPIHINHTTYDSNAFIFRLAGPQKGLKPKVYRLKPGRESSAIIQNNQKGPCFGNDLQCIYGTINKSRNYFQGNLNVAVGSQYDMQGDNATTFCGNNVQFTEIQVYQVTGNSTQEEAGPAKVEEPWRKVSQSNHTTLMSHIERYSPPESCKVKAINLLLLGQVGAGKSSFFNSVNTIFKREITTMAASGGAIKSLTTTYRRYRLRSSETGETLKIRLCDTRGLESDGGLDLVDLITIIEGHVPDRFQFNPTVRISPESTGYNRTPSPDDQIHCVAFVIDGTAIDFLEGKLLEVFKSLQQRLYQKGIPQVVILTKTDKVCHEVQKDAGRMFWSTNIADLVDKAALHFGLQRSCVFPVKNYEEELEVNEKVDVPILLCLKHVLRCAEDYIQDSVASD